MNNFQRMEHDDGDNYQSAIEQVKSNLDGSMDLMRLIGNIVEVFVPRFFDTVIVSSGGDASSGLLYDGAPPDGGGGPQGKRGPTEINPGRPN